jgi:hypothetical protein
MNWIKKGFIYEPNKAFSWNQSHAQVPVVDILNDKVWRIYFSTRDSQSRSTGSYIDVEAGNPSNVLYVHDQPILPFGAIGTFDDCGVMPSWVVQHGSLKYMYYIGWNVRNTIPYHNAIGLAISQDGGHTYQKFSEGPIIERNHIEPYFNGTSCVLIDSDGTWKNWYLSCTGWKEFNGKVEPFYNLKYAESADGIHWKREGKVAINYKDDNEAGLVKASVLKENGLYKMWYAYRNLQNYRTDPGNSYRIGYAESGNGIDWERKDALMEHFTISEHGWDSQMIAYPHVIQWQGQKYMFYNGNGFGQSGFGYAVLDTNS